MDATSTQDNIVQPNIVTDNTTNNMEQPIDNNVYSNNMDATSTQDNIVQPNIVTDNTVNSTEQTVDNSIYPNNTDSTPIQDSIVQPTTVTDNTTSNMEQPVDNSIYPNNTDTTPIQDSIVQPTTVTDNTTSNMEQPVDNSIYPNNTDSTPIQDSIVQPTTVTDNTTNNMEQPVDHNIYPNNIDSTPIQDSIIQPTTPTDNTVNNMEQTVDNNIYSNNMDATSTQDNIVQPNISTDNIVNNMEQPIDSGIYPNNTDSTPIQDNIVQPTTPTDNTTSNMEQPVNNNTEENVSIQNNNDSVTLGTVEVKGSDGLKMEAIENKKKKIKKIINITIISVVGLIILAIIIGLTYFLINRNKNKVDRIGLVVDKFVEKSNLNDISNTINFINSYLHGNLVDSANYIDSNYKFKININSQIGALKDLSNYNYTYSIIPREGYKQYRITVGTDNVENYMLDIVGAHYNDNDYYRFKGIDDDNEYVRTSDENTGFKLQFPDVLGQIDLNTNFNNMLSKIKEVFKNKEFTTSEEEININETSYKVYKDTIIFTKDEMINILKEFTNGFFELDSNLIYDLKLDFYTDKSNNSPLKIDITYNQNLITILLVNNEYRVINYDDTNNSTININNESTNITITQNSENNYTFSLNYTHNENELTLRLVSNINGEDLVLDFVGKKDDVSDISAFIFDNAKDITEFNNPAFMLSLLPTPFYKNMYQYNTTE